MNNTTSYYLDGKLDDLRVWSRALSEQEIMQLQDLPPGVTVVDTTICQGDSLTLFGGYSDAYQWGPAAGLACDTCAMPLAIPQVTTTYRLFTNNGFGCVDTYSIRVFVEDCTLPACAAVPLGASFHAVASGLGVTLSDQSGGQVDSVVFDLGNGVQLSGLPGQVFAYTYPQAGSYPVCLRAYARLGPDSLCVDSSCLTVQASPGVACDQLHVSVDFSQQVQGLVATFSDQSSGGSYDGVSWSFGDGSTLVGQPGGVVSHSYPGAGSYQVCLTVTDSLADGSLCQSSECRILTLVDSAASNSTAIRPRDSWPIRLQPNPGREAVQVIQPQAQPVVITVFDAWGRQVWSGQSHRRSTRLDAAAWPVGWYLVRVEGRAGQRTLRWWKR